MPIARPDLPNLLKGIPAGAWVAISESQHRILAFGPDAQAVIRQARDQGEPAPLVLRIPESQAAVSI